MCKTIQNWLSKSKSANPTFTIIKDKHRAIKEIFSRPLSLARRRGYSKKDAMQVLIA